MPEKAITCAAVWHKPRVILQNKPKSRRPVCFFAHSALALTIILLYLHGDAMVCHLYKYEITQAASVPFTSGHQRVERKAYIAWLASRIIETWLNPENSTMEFAIIEAKRVLYPPTRTRAAFPYLNSKGNFRSPTKQMREKRVLCPFLIFCQTIE